MSYRCGMGRGMAKFGYEEGPPRITCDACSRVLEIPNRLPPKWLLDNRAAPKWTLIRKESPDGLLVKRLDFCPDCTLEKLLAERDDARAVARGLAYAYEHDVTPGIAFQKMVAVGLAYPAIPPRLR